MHGKERWISRIGIAGISFLFAVYALGSVPGRKVAIVKFRGEEVPTLLETSIERIGGYAVKNGCLVAIPFQIDECDKTGMLIYTTYSGGTTAKRTEILDDQDEILIMAQDAGEKRKEELMPAGATGGMEIKITDPLGGPDSWFYLVTFDGKAPRSDVDYVQYDPKKDWITARYYAVGFPYKQALQVPSHFSLSEEAGGDGRNIYDLYKIRLKIDLRFIDRITKSQNDFITVLVGYIDGPIRVCRRVKSALRIAGPIRSAMVYSDTHYYPYYCVFPSRLQIPFKLEYIAWSASVRVSDDFSPHAKGMTWYNNLNSGGIELTGKPLGEQEKLDRGDYQWKVVTGPQGTMMNYIDFDSRMTGMEKRLYFCDDEEKPDEPCQFRGQIGNSGYMLTDLRSIPRGNYKMAGYVFCLVDYKKGEEEGYIDSILNPLLVSATPLLSEQEKDQPSGDVSEKQ